MRDIKIEMWINAGYGTLAYEGFTELNNIENLARKVKRNKSGFYYYFGRMDSYLKALMQLHIRKAGLLAAEIRMCRNIDPDFLLLVVRHKIFFQAESQLLTSSCPEFVKADLETAGNIISKELLPLWRTATQLPENSTVALASLNILRHFFYSRIHDKKVTYDLLHELFMETKDVLGKAVEERINFSRKN